MTAHGTSRQRAGSAGRTDVLLGVGICVFIEGLVVIRIGPSYAFATAVLTAIGGWAIAGSGLAAWRLAPSSRVGKWLVLAGTAFLAEAIASMAWQSALVAGQLTWLSLGFLGAALLTMPDGRPRARAGAIITAAFLLVTIVIPPDRPLLVGVALAAAMLLRRNFETRDHRRGPADLMGLVMILVLAAMATTGSFEPVPAFDTFALYAAASAALAMVIAAVVIQGTPTVTRVTDAVLRVDPAIPLSIGRELRRTTGQASLRVVFPLVGGAGYVDASGEPFELPQPAAGRIATPIVSADGHVEAMVIHDRGPGAAISLDPGIARAGALAAANARLQAELRRQVSDVRASRRRALDTEQAERLRLRERLADALLPALADIESGLERLDGSGAPTDVGPATPGAPDPSAIITSVRELRQAVDAVTEGLHPAIAGERALDGAVRRAVARSPVATTVTMAGLEQPLDPDVAATAWYVCSEALANVAKHARASRASVQITRRDGRLVVKVEDDGVGGADPAAGTGLRGLRDRLDAMGGALRIERATGGGTRVLADLPLGTPRPPMSTSPRPVPT